jgi:2-dehydropantoate 2-reductase
MAASKAPDFERIVVMGAGSLGSIIGAKLSSVIPTLLVGRRDHVARIQTEGLHIGGTLNETIRVDAVEFLPADLSSTLVLVTAKTTALASIAETLAHAITPTTTVVIACNGYRPENHMRASLNDSVIVHRILVTAGAHFVSPGHVDYWGAGGIDLPESPLGKKLSALFKKAGFTTELFAQFDFAVWRKLTANCVLNPLTALLRVRNSAVVVPELDAIRKGIVDECIKGALTDDVNLPADYSARLDKVILQSNNVSSMLQDILRGHSTEIDDINGAVVKLGSENGFPTPLNSFLTQLIRAHTATPVKVQQTAGT